jgi:putative hydrolase of HD superfamily
MTIFNFLTGNHQYRPSRFRDKRGNAPADLRHAWLSLATSLLRRTPFRPTMPWLPIEAIRQIDRYLRCHPDATCLEYGSGMSTVWLARRCRHLWSVEDSPEWFDRVQQQRALAGVENITYKLCPNRSDYLNFPPTNDRFDFILVDGAWRPDAVRQALYHLKPHGWLYLDDTDRATHDANNSQAELALRRYAQEMGGQVIYLTDFVVHEFKVRQGALLMSAEKTAMQKKTSMVRPGRQASPVARVYFELHHLKHLYRQGWLKAGIAPEQCESVAEHSFGVAVLAWLVAGEIYPHLDQFKVLEMALLHDLAEARVGDFTPGTITPEQKHRREREALAGILGRLGGREDYLALWDEYEAGESAEAKLVRQLDRLEMALQAAAYQQKFPDLDLAEFFESSRQRVEDETLLEILNEAQHRFQNSGSVQHLKEGFEWKETYEL